MLLLLLVEAVSSWRSVLGMFPCPITIVHVVTAYNRPEPIRCIMLPVTDIIPFFLRCHVQIDSNLRVKVQKGMGETLYVDCLVVGEMHLFPTA